MLSQSSTVGLRCQDIQTGLQEIDVDSFAPGEFHTLPLTGMAARLALHIRGKEVLSGKQLHIVASKIGIKGTEIRGVIRHLEEVEWVRAQSKGANIDRVTAKYRTKVG